MDMSTGLKKAIVVGNSWGVSAGFELREFNFGLTLEGQYSKLFFDVQNEDVYVDLKHSTNISFESVGEELAEMRAAQQELMPILITTIEEKKTKNVHIN